MIASVDDRLKALIECECLRFQFVVFCALQNENVGLDRMTGCLDNGYLEIHMVFTFLRQKVTEKIERAPRGYARLIHS